MTTIGLPQVFAPESWVGTDASEDFGQLMSYCWRHNREMVLPHGEITIGAQSIGAAGNYSSVRIVGRAFEGHYSNPDNYGSKLKLKSGVNDTMFSVAAGDAAGAGPAPLQMENVLLAGNRDNQTGTSHAVNFPGHTASSDKQRSGFFRRCLITDFLTSGIRVGQIRNAGILDQVAILDVGSGGVGSALQFGSCSDWRFINCDFGVSSGPAVQDSGADNVFFANCNFFSAGTHCYKGDTAAQDHYFVNCSFDRAQRDGVNIGTTGDYHWVFTNCNFTLNSQEADDTYADMNVGANNTKIVVLGSAFAAASGNKPQYNFRIASGGAVAALGCSIDSGAAVTGIVSGSNFTRFDASQARFGTYTAGAATDSTGFITILDAAGNTRKLMVQA